MGIFPMTPQEAKRFGEEMLRRHPFNFQKKILAALIAALFSPADTTGAKG